MKALFEHTMLPRVLAGSSVGSIVAGIISTRTDDEMREMFRKLDDLELTFFNNNRPVELVTSFLQKGALHDMSYLQVRGQLLLCRSMRCCLSGHVCEYVVRSTVLSAHICHNEEGDAARLQQCAKLQG